MELYFILTSLGFLLFAMAVIGMVWMIRSGQTDDLDTPALRMLADDSCPDHWPDQSADQMVHQSPAPREDSRRV